MNLFFSVSIISSLFAVFLFNGKIQAKDWVDSYLHRSEEESDITDLIEKQYGGTRKTFNLNGLWEAKKQSENEWKQVWVPGAFDFEGEVEFKRTFVIDSSFIDYTFQIVAFGINKRSTFFINDEFQGGHVDGHTSFFMDIGNEKLIIGGENEIRIVVNNSLDPRRSLPLKHNPRIVRNYGGVFRDIFILAIPKVNISELTFNQFISDDLKQCRLEIHTVIRNNDSDSENLNDLKLHFEVWDIRNNKLIARSSHETSLSDNLVLELENSITLKNIEIWSPDNPLLFELRAYLSQKKNILDEIQRKIGFSDFKISGNTFMLKGQTFSLNGIDWYEDYPESGPAAGWNTIKEEILRIKELGVNVVRVLGTPPHPFFLDLCDELGVFVFIEIPLSLIPDRRLQEREFAEMATKYFQEVLNRNSHHVSLAGWGLGSDLEYDKIGTQIFIKKLTRVLRQKSDLPTYLALRNYKEKLLPEYAADFTILEGYGIEPDAFFTSIKQYGLGYSNTPCVISYGTPLSSNTNNLLSSSLITSSRQSEKATILPSNFALQEQQAFKLQRVLLNVELNQNFAGVFIHTFADWPGTRPNLIFGANENPFINTTGLVNRKREKRISYEVVQSVFKKNQKSIVPDQQSESQNPIVYPFFGLSLILLFLYSYNRSRKFRGNLRRIFLYPHGFYTEILEKRKISIGHTFLLSFITFTVGSIVLSSIVFKFRNDLIFNEILDLVIVANTLKLQLIWLIWHPLIFILVFTAMFYLISSIFLVFLRFATFVLGQNLPINQLSCLIFWASANLVWLLPVIPIYYRLINKPGWTLPVILLFILFIMWCLIRVSRGLKVVFQITAFKTVFFIIVLFVIFFGGMAWFYDSNQALFDYIPLYWSFVKPN